MQESSGRVGDNDYSRVVESNVESLYMDSAEKEIGI